tara:strand:+ start:332 stop:661 length:330 start_codon:yes stop_codon:yes gene_type:complete
MRTEKYRETIGSNTDLSEVECFTIGPVNHASSTIVAHSASTNVRLRIYYLFEEDNVADTEKLIRTIDLTQNVVEIINFDMKLRRIKVTRDDTGSNAGGGDLHIDGTTAK